MGLKSLHTIKAIFFLVIIGINSGLYSQVLLTDSLINVAINSDDEKKVDIFNELFFLFEFSDTAKASLYSKQALELAIAANYKQGIIDSYVSNGYFAEDHSDYALAIDFYRKALSVSKEIKNKYNIASNYKNLGNVNLRQGNYTEAINNYQQALKISEEISDNNLISKCLTNIGSIYLYQKNYEKAIANYEKSIEIAEVLKDKGRIANCLNNIGLACQLNNDYNKANESFNKALIILQEINDIGGLADCYHNLGIVNSPRDSVDRDYTLATEYYTKALKLYEEIGNKKGISLSYNSLGELLLMQEKYHESIEYSEKSLEIALEIGAKDDVANAYKNITQCYKRLKMFDKAYEYFEKFYLAKDSLNLMQSIQLQAELEAKYDNEKKQKEIELKNIELAKKDAIVKQKTTFQYALIIIIVLVIVFSIFLFRSNSNKRKANKLLQEKNLIIEEKNRDITNSIKYAKRIQGSIMPPDELMRKIFNDSFVLFKPKDIVSGDFYWLDRVGDKVLFAVVDCTGHGVPGAFISIIGYNGLNRAVNEFKLTKPSDILNKLNDIVNETIKQSIEESTIRDGMDIAVCCLDIKNMKLEYAGANNPIYIVRNSKVLEFKASKRPIGHFIGVELVPFDNNEIELQENDSIYVFSDGYADQFGGPDNKKFKYSKLKDTLISVNSKPLEEQKDILDNTINDWMRNVEQIDDICIVGVKV